MDTIIWMIIVTISCNSVLRFVRNLIKLCDSWVAVHSIVIHFAPDHVTSIPQYHWSSKDPMCNAKIQIAYHEIHGE